MTIEDAAVVALILWTVFAYHSLGLTVLVSGSSRVPAPLRKALLPRPAATGLLRMLSLLWVGLVVLLSQALAIGILATRPFEQGAQYALWLELLAALAWAGIVARFSRRA